jgi:hypothetical protein
VKEKHNYSVREDQLGTEVIHDDRSIAYFHLRATLVLTHNVLRQVKFTVNMVSP